MSVSLSGRPARVALVGLLAGLVTAAAFAAFTNPFTPDYRGTALSQYAHWESFTYSSAGLNDPTDPASTAPATLEQLNPNAFVTGGGNLYIFSGIPEYVLRSTSPAALRHVAMQTSTVGNELDYLGAALEYVDGFGVARQIAVTSTTELARYPAMGMAVEMLFEWDLRTLGDDVTEFAIRFFGADTNISLDALTLDVLHESPVVSYCSAKVTSQGCAPELSTSGHPNANSAQPFFVTATGVIPGAPGTFFYGLSGAAATPFQGGTVCVAGPLRRTPVAIASSAAACASQLSFDFNAWIASGVDMQLAPGAAVHLQAWSRDGADAHGSSFSNAISFTVAP
jgi:hypothetical protein